MEANPPEPGRSTDLCKSCGLCCSGVLFDWVSVADGERKRLTSLGFHITEGEAEPRFAQPCTMHDGRICTVYADRPARCARYRCELLKKVEAGEVPVPRAMEVVAQAKQLIEQVKPMLEEDVEGRSVGLQWQVRFREWQSLSSVERQNESESRLLLLMTLLNRFLDRHFRNENQRRLMDE